MIRRCAGLLESDSNHPNQIQLDCNLDWHCWKQCVSYLVDARVKSRVRGVSRCGLSLTWALLSILILGIVVLISRWSGIVVTAGHAS